MSGMKATMMEINKQEQAQERKDYKEMRKIENQQRNEAKEQREAQQKADKVK